MISTSHIELSKSALENNLKYLRNYIGDDVQFSSVVKSNAYGHGIKHFIPLAISCGIEHFSVFSAEEAKKVLNAAKSEIEIMIMGYIRPRELEWIINNEVSFYIFNVERLKHTLEIAKKIKKTAFVHLELETGLHRTGLEQEELPEVIKIIKKNKKNIVVSGVCTHFAGAESIANYYRIQQQIKKFEKLTLFLRRKGISTGLHHTACSAAALIYPETIKDMVRFGIAQYGFWPSKETEVHFFNRMNKQGGIPISENDSLKRVLSWRSSIMALKHVSKGEYISYGNSFLSLRDMTIASVPVGYYQGYPRKVSNHGYVLINGKRAKIVGIINMNMMVVDVTDIPSAKIGDEVMLIGRQGDDEISVTSFSDMARNLNYETLVSLPHDIERLIVD
ncbi:MAG: alanine racemase [Deltaproteobacteria bacterium]|jgi:alanine racemase|nr:alanine racemase [Deltaproteobacteria bacterium]